MDSKQINAEQTMKTRKLYEIRMGQGRSHSVSASTKLRTYPKARRLVARLRRMGHDAFAAPITVRS
jgi:hypothetical protein